jgi:hypothetical protein
LTTDQVRRRRIGRRLEALLAIAGALLTASIAFADGIRMSA